MVTGSTVAVDVKVGVRVCDGVGVNSKIGDVVGDSCGSVPNADVITVIWGLRVVPPFSERLHARPSRIAANGKIARADRKHLEFMVPSFCCCGDYSGSGFAVQTGR
jgi:hypothetical protein